MTTILTEIAILILLIVLNGIFAMSEIAIVSARRTRLENLAADGDAGARTALDLAHAPTRFLSTVQIGITLIGIIAGAFGGATLAQELARLLAPLPVVGPRAGGISFFLVVAFITYFSVVLGELVPKRLGLQNAERIAAAVARPMRWLSVLATPVVRLLSLSTEGVLRLLNVADIQGTPVSEEEIEALARESAAAGLIEAEELAMVRSVFRFADLPVERLMTPRTEIVWLDANAPESAVREVVEGAVHSHFPVCDGELDSVLGVVQTKELLRRSWAGQPLDLRAAALEPLLLPERMPALQALERFKATGMHMALLIDEFGGISGVVTLINILETLVGDIPTPEEIREPPLVRRDDGSWLVDGLFRIDDLKPILRIDAFPDEDDYQTVGGFIIYMTGQVPETGATCQWQGYRFEVVDMDGQRVDKVLIS